MNPSTAIETGLWPRNRVYLLSRAITVLVVGGALGSFFWTPQNGWEIAVDILLRSYLLFLGCTMAHEACHGHLGATRTGNLWWGRLAQFPTTTPNVNFRKTHIRHHVHTNIPESDPDHFLKPRNFLEVPFRSVLLPHYWFRWLLRRKQLSRKELVEIGLWYLAVVAVYGAIAWAVGPVRFAYGLFPPLVILSCVLWYPFAVKTHEGYSTGSQESRSHNYYNRALYWLTLGLSLHRVHHLYPELAWIDMAPHTRELKGSLADKLLLRRDIRVDPTP